MIQRCFLVALGVMLLAGIGAPLHAAHPFHVSLCEVERNSDSGNLECALRVHPIDLEKALRLQEKSPVDLDKTPGIDAMIGRYLTNKFVVTRADGDRAKLVWVGKEVSLKHAWIYFEVPIGKEPEAFQLANRVFFEIVSDQTNTVNLKERKRRLTVNFRKDSRPAKIDFWVKSKSRSGRG